MRNKLEALTLIQRFGFNPVAIVDVGVATGTIGLYETWPATKYFLVEALPQFDADLQRISAGLADCECVNAFAGRSAGMVEIAVDPNADHAHVIGEAPAEWGRATVPIVTVDSLVAPLGLGPSTEILLKVDVDGKEIDVLEGARGLLGSDAVVISEAALLDTDMGRFSQIVVFMSQLGYEVFDIVEPLCRPVDDVLWQVDLIFCRRSSPLRGLRSFA